MKILIVSLCSVFLLGCSLSSNQTESTSTEKLETVSLDQKIITGNIITEETASQNPLRGETVEATIGEQVFTLEVSRTKADRELGLMHRDSMQYNQGMLFDFEIPARHRFWMKNTLVPLDILWLDEQKKIIHFETTVPCYTDPCDIYGPTALSKYVIELPAGSFVEEIGTAVKF